MSIVESGDRGSDSSGDLLDGNIPVEEAKSGEPVSPLPLSPGPDSPLSPLSPGPPGAEVVQISEESRYRPSEERSKKDVLFQIKDLDLERRDEEEEDEKQESEPVEENGEGAGDLYEVEDGDVVLDLDSGIMLSPPAGGPSSARRDGTKKTVGGADEI